MRLLLIVTSLFTFGHSFCQPSTVEDEIRRLEQMEVKAVLEKVHGHTGLVMG